MGQDPRAILNRVPDHYHDGIENQQVTFDNLKERKHIINHTIVGTAAATAANYAVFWIAPWSCVITKIKEVHQTAGSDAGSVTLDIEKLTGTQALDAGASALSSTFNLKAIANTVQTGSLTTTLANRRLAAGDRLAMKDSGTLTNVSNVTIITEVQY